MHTATNGRSKPAALSLLSSERPRNVGWKQAAGLLFGDWGTSRLYVLGLAFFFAKGTSLYLISAMSLLILAVAWAYTQICRIYPDGGGVYTAAKHKSVALAVVGALLLFADYTVTASLSSLDGFHYFGLPFHVQSVRVEGPGDLPGDLPAALPAALAGHVTYDPATGTLTSAGKVTAEEEAMLLAAAPNHAGYAAAVDRLARVSNGQTLLAWDSPGLWAIAAIVFIGACNLLGPRHTGGFAILAAVAMVGITLLIALGSLPHVNWATVVERLAVPSEGPGGLWLHFVAIVLALSGVEAIGNLTGVMKKPVARTARRAIWVVAVEVAAFNVLLAVCMVSRLSDEQHAEHKEDMLAFLSGSYVGPWAEWGVRVVGGVLLLSACNTVITDMISVQYLMSRDGELPPAFQRLNRFGVPWLPAVVATAVPALVLVVNHDLEHLAALYAIGVVGAVAINVTLVGTHPRLRGTWRKAAALALGGFLLAVWVTLAATKLHALAFVAVVLAVGLTARSLTRWLAARRGPRPSPLRQAIMEQLSPRFMDRPKVLVGTYGSEAAAPAAFLECRRTDSALVVCFVRHLSLSYKYRDSDRLTIDTDLAALRTFGRFLDLGHEYGVEVIPVYDTGPDAAELMAEAAAVYGVRKVLLGTSRQGAFYHLVKGHFQQRLEGLLPPEVPVEVVGPADAEAAKRELEALAASATPPAVPDSAPKPSP